MERTEWDAGLEDDCKKPGEPQICYFDVSSNVKELNFTSVAMSG